MTDNVKGQGKDTFGRKRSTGRPSETKAKRTGPQPDHRHDAPEGAARLVRRPTYRRRCLFR
jgi:hypothetical protein